MIKKLILILTGTTFFLLPWYLFDSGLPQPVDIPILLLVAVFCCIGLNYALQIVHSETIYKLFIILSIYTVIVLLLNFIIDNDMRTLYLLEQNLYYIVLVTTFLLMFAYFYIVCDHSFFYKLILYFLLIDSILPFLYLLKLGSLSGRIYLTFNNPNQLGFYVLVNMSLFTYISLFARERQVNTKKIISLIIINVNLLFLFLSSSRAGYPVILLYVISYGLIFRLNFRGYGFLLFSFITSCISLYGIFILGYELYLRMVHSRLSMFSQDYFSLSSEIYFRAMRGITHNFERIKDFLFGVGSYTTVGRDNLEFHNNFFNIFNQIGIVGLIIYLYMTAIIIKELYKKGLIYIAPYACYLFYSSFHYSYRTRFNWLFLAMIIFIVMYNNFLDQYKLKRN